MVTKSMSIHCKMAKKPIFKISGDFSENAFIQAPSKSKRKAMNRNWCNQKANPALNTKGENIASNFAKF